MKTSLRVLLIDDNADDRLLAIHELRREFKSILVHEVSTAANLKAALESNFDVAITDYCLRWSDGLAVLRQLKRLHPHRPVIMFTGTGNEEVAVEAMKSGLDDYVLKSPKHYMRLPAAVSAVVERAESRTRAAELELRLQNLLDKLNVGVFRANAEGMILQANPAFLKLLGWERLPNEMFLRELYVRPELYAQHWHELNQRGELREFQIELCRANGKPIFISMSQTLAVSSEGEALVEGLVEDISDRVKFEEEFRQSQKMDSVGRLAAGVAHDFNNILTIIHGYASLLAEKDFDADTLFSLKNISAAADRAATLTRHLLAFSRKQPMQMTVLDIGQLTQSFSNLLHHVLGDKISLRVNMDAHLPPLRGDGSAIEQILVNLANNSRDAMPDGGVLDISLTEVEIGSEYFRLHPEARMGHFVCLTVHDSGYGIPRENLSHIFEPFFTTKEVGKGAGLGLAAVYGIIKQHKGWIEVASQVGQGTTFKIFLPAEIRILTTTPAPGPVRKQGNETVLLVEDEPELLDIVSEVLFANGYQVIPAPSAKMALEAWHISRQKIDLLVTDMRMPDASGMDLAQTLSLDKPNLKVLYTSGYTPDLLGPKVDLTEGQNFLQKPYPPERLLSAIRACLERR